MDRDEMIRQAAGLLRKSRRTVVLTGAGASTESGIPDFRSKGGLWSRYDPREYGTIGAFRRDPARVWKMLAELLAIVDARPNPGHRALARLEHLGHVDGIITQNIDGLHQRAGSHTVVEFHGSLETFSCMACGARTSLNLVRRQSIPPGCAECGALLKPDVVFFDEQIPCNIQADSEELLAGTDLLLVAGTSCQVAPASLLPQMVVARGGKIIEINLEPVLGQMATVVLAGGFSLMMTRLLDELTGEPGGAME